MNFDKIENKTTFIDKLFPIIVIGPVFIAFILQVVIYSYFIEHTRMLIISYIGIFSVIDVLVGVRFCVIARKYRDQYKFIVGALIIAFLFILPYFYSMYHYSSSSGSSYIVKNEMISLIMQFIVFKFPIFLVIMCVILTNSYKAFLNNFKYYSVILMPLCIVYIIRILTYKLDKPGESLSIGFVDYMGIAFICLNVLFALILNLAIDKHKKQVTGVLFSIASILWITILYTGTRSALISGIFFLLLVIIWLCVTKKIQYLKRIVVLSVAFLVISVFSFSVWAPANSGVSLRMGNFIYETSEHDENLSVYGKLSTERGRELEKTYTNYIVNSNQQYEQSVKDIQKDIKDQSGNIILVKPSDNIEALLAYEINFDRITLWRFAIEEFKTAPIFGHGLMYYQTKYMGFYPHCMLLELLADTGIVGVAIFIIGMLYLLIRAFKKNKGNMFKQGVILYSLGFIPIYLLATGLYTNTKVMFTIWLLLYLCMERQNDGKERI